MGPAVRRDEAPIVPFRRGRPGADADARRDALRRRFRKVTARPERRGRVARLARGTAWLRLAVGVMALILAWPVGSAPWSFEQKRRDVLAAAECATAFIAEVPAQRGERRAQADLDPDDDAEPCIFWLP